MSRTDLHDPASTFFVTDTAEQAVYTGGWEGGVYTVLGGYLAWWEGVSWYSPVCLFPSPTVKRVGGREALCLPNSETGRWVGTWGMPNSETGDGREAEEHPTVKRVMGKELRNTQQ